MSTQTVQRYVVRLTFEVNAAGPQVAIDEALHGVPVGALSRAVVDVEEIHGGAVPGVPVARTWGDDGHAGDTRYRSDFLGVASCKVVRGTDR